MRKTTAATQSNVEASVKVIGKNGQISLGKEFAGRQVLVEVREPGVWLIRTALVIPESELWLHEPKAQEDLRQAIAWALANPPQDSDPEVILEEFESARKPRSSTRKPSQSSSRSQ